MESREKGREVEKQARKKTQKNIVATLQEYLF